MTDDTLLQQITAKKGELDQLRGRTPDGLSGLEHTQDLELTYTSNAIGGNTLTAVETTLVIENGITIGGKPLKDHLEAVDHYEAVGYVRELARQVDPLTESDVRNLHRLVMLRSDPQERGQYARTVRHVLTDTPPGQHYFPTPAEIPARMGDFADWLRTAPITPQTAFDAHRELVSIHPFRDGNGRAARLLMNLILLRGGYPPIAVRPQDRAAYLDALQQAQGSGGAAAFNRLLYERLDATLAEHLSALRQALPAPPTPRAALGDREKVTGARADRRELNRMLAKLAPGDVVTVTRIDRLARSTFDLFAIVKGIVDAKAQFRSLAEPWADTGTSTGRLMLAVLGGLADVERDLIRTRTAEGRSRAKAQGKHMGRPPSL